jgi:hypothetical protein
MITKLEVKSKETSQIEMKRKARTSKGCLIISKEVAYTFFKCHREERMEKKYLI